MLMLPPSAVDTQRAAREGGSISAYAALGSPHAGDDEGHEADCCSADLRLSPNLVVDVVRLAGLG